MLVQAGQTALLIDAGLRVGHLKELLADRLGRLVLNGIILTHSHSDHAAHVNQTASLFDAPVFMTRGTAQRVRLKSGVRRRLFSATGSFRVGAITLEALPLPHDVPQVALRFTHASAQAALVTDLGSIPPGLSSYLRDCHTVLLEANHDVHMLKNGPYPPSLKARVASDHGHLSNDQTAAVLCMLSPRVRRVVLMHLSLKNNHPDLARAAATDALKGRATAIDVAGPFPFLELTVRAQAVPVAAAQLSLAL